MSADHETTLKTIDRILKESYEEGSAIRWDEVQERVLYAGGALRGGINYTLGDYFKDLEEDGIITFSPQERGWLADGYGKILELRRPTALLDDYH